MILKSKKQKSKKSRKEEKQLLIQKEIEELSALEKTRNLQMRKWS